MVYYNKTKGGYFVTGHFTFMLKLGQIKTVINHESPAQLMTDTQTDAT